MNDRRLPRGWWLLPYSLIGALMWVIIIGAVLTLVGAVEKVTALDDCYAVPVTTNTPTGIAGCHREGDGTASHYGPGTGVAMNFCTWERRTSTGCGSVTIQSHTTGLTVIVPVVDFCDCYTGTERERIVDLQYGVLDALGLDRSLGLYPVTVTFGEAFMQPRAAITSPTEPPTVTLPDTAMAAP